MWKLCRGQLCRAGRLRSGAGGYNTTTKQNNLASTGSFATPWTEAKFNLKVQFCLAFTKNPSFWYATAFAFKGAHILLPRFRCFPSKTLFHLTKLFYGSSLSSTGRASRWFTLNNDRKMSVFDYTKSRGDLWAPASARTATYLPCGICASRWQISYFCGRLQGPFFPPRAASHWWSWRGAVSREFWSAPVLGTFIGAH